MLTPFFQLSQTNDKLYIKIHAPYSNISDAEIYVDKDDFRFYSSPFYLRLHLPGHVVDCDEPIVQYDCDNGQFNIELIKLQNGEHFKDLDLIAKFLSPQKNKRINVKPDIQILNSSTNDDNDNADNHVHHNDNDEKSDDSSDEWLLHQDVPTPTSEFHSNCLCKTKYGFANQVTDVFRIVKDEFKEIFDADSIEETSNADRNKLRKETEDDHFDDDHYLCDLMEPSPQLLEALQWNFDYSLEVKLSVEELEKLKSFGNKEYLLTKEDRRTAFLSLIDIVFGYAYDQRTTSGEATVESAWTINKLSATLSWLQSFSNVRDIVLCCIRRSLCYPLFRHWELSLKILDDTICILKSGNRRVLRCLLKVHKLFNTSEPRYILNQLYITDYCIWLHGDTINSKLSKLSDHILEVKNSLKKQDLGLDIDILEVAAYSTLEEDLLQDFGKINLKEQDRKNMSSSSSEDESSYESDNETELDSDDDDLPEDEKSQE